MIDYCPVCGVASSRDKLKHVVLKEGEGGVIVIRFDEDLSGEQIDRISDSLKGYLPESWKALIVHEGDFYTETKKT